MRNSSDLQQRVERVPGFGGHMLMARLHTVSLHLLRSLAMLAVLLVGMHTPASAELSAYWHYSYPYDGEVSEGSWAKVKEFSEAKTTEYYGRQGFLAKCVWLTPEPSPPRSIVGTWGGTYYYSDGSTSACGGAFVVTWVCPSNSESTPQGCKCASGYQEGPVLGACVKAAPKQSCDAGSGNPIFPATADKVQSEVDFTDSGPAPLIFGRTYRSTWANDASLPLGMVCRTRLATAAE